MRTRTEWIVWNRAHHEIQQGEEAGWSVRLIVPAKRPDPRSSVGVAEGFLVVFEKEQGE